MFISEGNSHLTSRFCEVELGPTTISKMVSEPPLRSIGKEENDLEGVVWVKN